MDDHADFYDILHVRPDAPAEIIKSSYRTLMQRLKQHPDLGGDHENAARINKAYATLSDPTSRAAYDREHHAAALRGRMRGSSNVESELQGGHEFRNPYRSLVPEHCVFCESPHEHSGKELRDAVCRKCGSPLRPVERHSADISDRRALERFPKLQAVRFITDWSQRVPHTGCIRDLSLDGVQLVTTHAVVEAQLIKIECDIFDSVALIAHVRREPDSWIVGAAFVTLRFSKSQGTFISTEV